MDYDKLESLINKTDGVSQTSLAKEIGASHQKLIYQIKNQCLSIENLELIANFFEKPISYFFDMNPKYLAQNLKTNQVHAADKITNYIKSGPNCKKCPILDEMRHELEDAKRDKETFRTLLLALSKNITEQDNNAGNTKTNKTD